MSGNEVESLGGKLGPRLAKIMADATIYTNQKLSGHKNDVAQQVLAQFTNHVSDEVREVFDGVFKSISDHPDTPNELRPAFHALATRQGQAFGWIGGSIAGTTMSAGLFDLINNWMAPVIHSFMAMTPNAFLSPETVAQARIRGLDYAAGERGILYDALGNGMNPERVAILEQLATNRPTINQTQELVNRGEWSNQKAQLNLRKLGYEPNAAEELISLRIQELSPDVLATMYNRDVVDMAEGKRRAAKSGLPEEDFERLAEIYGEPLSPQSLSEAFRRGFIDRERYQRGIVQGPLRKEWFDILEELQFSRMSTVDAADAYNQGHMTLDAAQQVSVANGLDANDFEVLVEIAGLPPGPDFMSEALNRGLIDEPTFNGAFLESRVKNKYVHLYREMAIRLIPQETVRLLYRNGVRDRERTLQTLLQHGFSQEDASDLLSLEEVRQDDTTKALTRAQIIDLYEVRAITLESTIELLLSLGYSENNARAMVELADFQRMQKFINSAVNRVKAAFLAGRMNETEASAQLDALGIPVDMRDDLFAIWDIDRTTISKTLSAAQIRQAYKKDLIGLDDAMVRLTSQGYDTVDAGIFLQLTA